MSHSHDPADHSPLTSHHSSRIPDPPSPFPIPHFEPASPDLSQQSPDLPKRGRPLTFDALKQHTFLRLVAVGFSTRRAAKLVGVSPSTVRARNSRNMSFASQYESAKAQAIPSLAENVYHAGQRSWRASAWLLERLRPSQFGRRLALGPDVTKIQEHKRQLALLEAERRAKILDDDAIVEVFDRLRGNRQLLAAAKNYLDEILANEAAWDRALARGKDERQDAQQPDDLASSSESATDAPQTEPSSACDEPHPYSDICAPTPSANNSTPNGQQPIPEVEPAQSLPATATPPIAPNLCAFTPIAPSAQIP